MPNRKNTTSIDNNISPQPVENKPKGILERIGYKLFDWSAGGKEKKEFSFHFNQESSLINKLKHIIPAIGIIATNGDKRRAKKLLGGLCFGLSIRYLMEERVNGPGGGQRYLSWLVDIVNSHSQIAAKSDNHIDNIQLNLLNQYRHQFLGDVLSELLFLHTSQDRLKNEQYNIKLQENGLKTSGYDDPVLAVDNSYDDFMKKLKPEYIKKKLKKNTYINFMSEDHEPPRFSWRVLSL